MAYGKMSGQIFISYRRDDSSAWAGRLYDHLSSHFASNHIFMDVDSLDLGIDFVNYFTNLQQRFAISYQVLTRTTEFRLNRLVVWVAGQLFRQPWQYIDLECLHLTRYVRFVFY
jgi:hypothetical protein